MVEILDHFPAAIPLEHVTVDTLKEAFQKLQQPGFLTNSRFTHGSGQRSIIGKWLKQVSMSSIQSC